MCVIHLFAFWCAAAGALAGVWCIVVTVIKRKGKNGKSNAEMEIVPGGKGISYPSLDTTE